MRSRFTTALLGAALIAGTAGTGLLGAATPAGASPAPIKIALISSLTGVASSEFSDTPQGFLARVAVQNAKGGVNGHKIVPIVLDDQGSLTAVQTAVQDAVSQGAVGVVSGTPFMFAAYKYLQQNGIPVTGGSFDGPEWGVQPNTNMFASDSGSVDPTYPVNAGIGQFFKSKGGTVVATYGYGISPSATRSAEGTAQSAQHAGLKVGVLDTSIPFGGVDFTNQALTAKNDHVNAVYAAMDNNSNFALLTALLQAGVHPKVVEFPTGYEADVVHSPAWKDLQGVYFATTFRPFSIPNAATQQFAAALQKYEHRSPSNFPTFNIYEGWLGADLMIQGLEAAGKNPTRAALISHLRKVTSYNGNGLLPESFDYATNFGHDNAKTCLWYVKAETNGFVPLSTTPVCASDIAGTHLATAPSS